ncbi:MAG: ABC transporter ATP-binding protein [Alphaproteobacteria bacterium]|nr:ABC transporter ATP-binding protein [Alphaproteobacteria bacterium]
MNQKNDIAVQVSGLAKNYGAVQALRGVDLTIGAGEYFVLLGPSGGGKTTLLRLLGGFIRPTAGQILLHGRDVSEQPPNRRPTSMVFQSFALFPHMTVAQNVGYGLRLRRLPKAEIAARVDAMLEMVGLKDLADRMPHALSGGQQQRVQLGRSLVLEADILLLDEPLAALDAKLRKDMCLELKHLQEQIGITFVHVTHNQEEAMTVADNMAIIADGVLVETGTAQDLYENPQARFTADFIGENNIFDGRVSGLTGSGVEIDLGFAKFTVDAQGQTPRVSDMVSVSIRSELVRVLGPGEAPEALLQTVPATYGEAVYLGLATSHVAKLANGDNIVARHVSRGGTSDDFEAEAPLTYAWPRTQMRLHLS